MLKRYSKVRLCSVTSLVSQLFATLQTVACQAPLSMGFSRQEYWSGLPCPSLGDLPDPGIEYLAPALQADSLPLSQKIQKITKEEIESKRRKSNTLIKS